MTMAAEIISTSELCDAMEAALAVRIESIERATSTYQSTNAVEELKVSLADGRRLDVVFKNIGPRAELENAREVRPAFLRDPRREILTYRHVLSQSKLDTPAFYGSVIDESSERYWLFMEDVPGKHLWQFGEFDRWLEAAKWLGRMHAETDARAREMAKVVPVIRYDAAFYRQWIERAAKFLAEAEISEEQQRGLEMLASGYERIVERLAGMEVTFLHGEFYASNVLVEQSETGSRIRPIDWEMSALGPGLVDLAALSAGKWSGERKRELAKAYYDASDRKVGFEEMMGELDVCRLHLAVQWLGWSAHWRPPKEHTQDWLGEAVELGERLVS